MLVLPKGVLESHDVREVGDRIRWRADWRAMVKAGRGTGVGGMADGDVS